MNGRRGLGYMPRVPAAVRLTQRDWIVFDLLKRARTLRAQDVWRLAGFSSLATTRRRMRRLLDGGWVRGFVTRLDHPTRWHLSTAGYRALELRPWRPRNRMRGFGSHHDLTVDVWVALTSRSDRWQQFQMSGPSLRSRSGYVPDATVSLDCRPRSLSCLVEVDCGTEKPAYIRDVKWPRLYGHVARLSGPAVVFLVCDSPVRLRLLGRTLRSSGVPVIGFAGPPGETVPLAHPRALQGGTWLSLPDLEAELSAVARNWRPESSYGPGLTGRRGAQ